MTDMARPSQPAFQYEWSAIVERDEGHGMSAVHLDQLATRARLHPARLHRRRQPPGLAAQCSNPNGWVCVDRSTRWGNWYRVERRDTPSGLGVAWAVVGPDSQVLAWPRDQAAAHRQAVDLYAAEVGAGALNLDEVVAKLRGRDLACYCAPGLACHCYPLLELANDGYICDCERCTPDTAPWIPTPEELARADAEVARQNLPNGKFYTGPITDHEYECAEQALGYPLRP